MDKMETFVRKTVEVIDPFLASKGGNIIMMQIENEYDSKSWATYDRCDSVIRR
jgi:Fe-S cluster biogenesis protein NfuA